MSASAINSLRDANYRAPLAPRQSENNNQISRISSISDRVFYTIYSFFNPAPCKPKMEFYNSGPISLGSSERAIPKPFEVVKAELLADNQSDSLLGPGLRACKAQLHLYEDPAFRIKKAREYYDRGLSGREGENLRNTANLYCVLHLCGQELYDLYHSEYKAKKEKMIYENNKWVHDMGEAIRAEDNKVILAQHKQAWDGMSASERAKKICFNHTSSQPFLVVVFLVTMVGCMYFSSNPFSLIPHTIAISLIVFLLKKDILEAL